MSGEISRGPGFFTSGQGAGFFYPPSGGGLVIFNALGRGAGFFSRHFFTKSV